MKKHRFRSFRAGKTMVGQLMSRREHARAYYAAQVLVQQFKTTAEAYFLLNLTMCLSNRGGGAWHAQGIIDDARELCPDFTPVIEGDMQRDRAIGLTRHFLDPEKDMARAMSLLQKARELHAGDINRLCCAQSTEGRVLFVLQQYEEAVAAHQGANDGWRKIGSKANPVWVYNNRIPWLKAVVMADGRNDPLAHWLEQEICDHVPPGEPSRALEAQLIRRAPGQLGPKTHDWMLRHYH